MAITGAKVRGVKKVNTFAEAMFFMISKGELMTPVATGGAPSVIAPLANGMLCLRVIMLPSVDQKPKLAQGSIN